MNGNNYLWVSGSSKILEKDASETIVITEAPPFNDLSNNNKSPSSFRIFDINKDLDRESLGLLPNASSEFDKTDFLLPGKESLNFGIQSLAFGRDSVSFGLDLNPPRESLGILNITSMDLGRESLMVTDISSLMGKESITPRESLGIMHNTYLDCQALDNSNGKCLNNIERESLMFMDINCFIGKESLTPRGSLGILNKTYLECQALEAASPVLLPSPNTVRENRNGIPEIVVHAEEKSLENVTSELNTAFIIDNSRKSSAASSGSVSPYFDSRALNEPSKIYSSSSQRTFEISTKSAVTPDDNSKDIFNNAAQGSSNLQISRADSKASVSSIQSDDNSKDIFNKAAQGSSNLQVSHADSNASISSIHSPNSCLLDNDDIKDYRARIQSLPVTLEEKSFEIVSCNYSFSGTRNENLDEAPEADQDPDFVDSVFIEANQMARKIADGSIYEESSDKEMDVLELTPQPDWPDDSDKSEEKCNDKRSVSEPIDQIVPTTAPLTTEEKTSADESKQKTDNTSSNEKRQETSKSHSTSSNDYNNSIASSTGTNKSHLTCNNLSRISQVSHKSEKNASTLLKNLSDILKENDVLSKSQKSEGQNLLHNLADIFKDTRSMDLSSEDSGHSSIVEHLEDNEKDVLSDLKPTDSAQEPKSISFAGSLTKPGPSRVSLNRSIPSTSRIVLPGSSMKTPNSSKEFNRTTTSNASTASATSSGSRNASGSSICKPSVAGKLRPPKVTTGMSGIKKGPLKAVLPVGEMKKNLITPRKTELDSHNMVLSKRTSTPIHEPKLKPMAASTPAYSRTQRHSKGAIASPLTKVATTPRPITESVGSSLANTGTNNNSFGYKPSVPAKLSSTSMVQPKQDNNTSKVPLNKSLINVKKESSPLVRRNSVSGLLKPSTATSENAKLKRSYSVGRESKIMSALSRVRQNILNSPYFDGRTHLVSNMPTENNNTSGLSENKKTVDPNKSLNKMIKSPSMISRLKKAGKENVNP